MAITIIKNGDVYGAEKSRIIGEIVGANIWRNKFLFHVNNIQPQQGNIATPYNHVDENYRLDNAPKTYDFFFNFLKLDYNEINDLWRNDAVEHMHFGLRAKANGTAEDDFGISKGDIDDILDASLPSLSTSFQTVDKITVTISSNQLSQSESGATLTTLPFSLVKGWDFNGDYPLAIGSRQTHRWDDYVPRQLDRNYSMLVRFFSGATELYSDNSTQMYATAHIIRSCNWLEETSTGTSSNNFNTEIDTILTADGDGGETNTTYWRRNTTHTFTATTGDYSGINAYNSILFNLFNSNWKVRKISIIAFNQALADNGESDGYIYSVGYQTPTRLDGIRSVTSPSSEVNWLIPYTGGDAFKGYKIHVSNFLSAPPLSIVPIIANGLDIWIEQDDGGFWNSIVGKVIAFAIVATAIIIAVIITVASLGTQSWTLGLAGSVAASLLLGGAMYFSSLIGNSGLAKMVAVAGIGLAVITAGAGIANAISSIGTTSVKVVTHSANGLITTTTRTVETTVSHVSGTVTNQLGSSGFEVVTTSVQGNIGVAIGITKNLAGIYQTVTNTMAGLTPPTVDPTAPDDNANSQDDINQYFFTSQYEVYEGMYTDYDGMFSYDQIFG